MCEVLELQDELKMILQDQSQADDQKVWLTTAQAGFSTAPHEGELKSIQDIQLGRPSSRHLHPAISAFILKLEEDIST